MPDERGKLAGGRNGRSHTERLVELKPLALKSLHLVNVRLACQDVAQLALAVPEIEKLTLTDMLSCSRTHCRCYACSSA
ncbi:hypothetical protein GPECTOR_3g31 [Gonium pectorale]|uniref:Uncharacterized protein n=1 Tax=Gonium pectorale TaxID=33097 RepID=A0A150GZL6_GONPE|nr:hypothetical protein GPECTOR_3g31 [Gonium pectorale]|eukprot:KXZ55162.1 hypothetical protein GPECTOR_3g31 [Gonium pectorale]